MQWSPENGCSCHVTRYALVGEVVLQTSLDINQQIIALDERMFCTWCVHSFVSTVHALVCAIDYRMLRECRCSVREAPTLWSKIKPYEFIERFC